MEEVIREAKELAADGVRELLIVAQDTTYYGLDLYGEVRFAALLRELEKVNGIEWIRILYAYPIFFTDELIEVIASSKKSCLILICPCSISMIVCCAGCNEKCAEQMLKHC